MKNAEDEVERKYKKLIINLKIRPNNLLLNHGGEIGFDTPRLIWIVDQHYIEATHWYLQARAAAFQIGAGVFSTAVLKSRKCKLRSDGLPTIVGTSIFYL